MHFTISPRKPIRRIFTKFGLTACLADCDKFWEIQLREFHFIGDQSSHFPIGNWCCRYYARLLFVLIYWWVPSEWTPLATNIHAGKRPRSPCGRHCTSSMTQFCSASWELAALPLAEWKNAADCMCQHYSDLCAVYTGRLHVPKSLFQVLIIHRLGAC